MLLRMCNVISNYKFPVTRIQFVVHYITPSFSKGPPRHFKATVGFTWLYKQSSVVCRHYNLTVTP